MTLGVWFCLSAPDGLGMQQPTRPGKQDGRLLPRLKCTMQPTAHSKPSDIWDRQKAQMLKPVKPLRTRSSADFAQPRVPHLLA